MSVVSDCYAQQWWSGRFSSSAVEEAYLRHLYLRDPYSGFIATVITACAVVVQVIIIPLQGMETFTRTGTVYASYYEGFVVFFVLLLLMVVVDGVCLSCMARFGKYRHVWCHELFLVIGIASTMIVSLLAVVRRTVACADRPVGAAIAWEAACRVAPVSMISYVGMPLLLGLPRAFISAGLLAIVFCAFVAFHVFFGADVPQTMLPVNEACAILLEGSSFACLGVVIFLTESAQRREFVAHRKGAESLASAMRRAQEVIDEATSVVPPMVQQRLLLGCQADQSDDCSIIAVDVADFPTWYFSRLPQTSTVGLARLRQLVADVARRSGVELLRSTGNTFILGANLLSHTQEHAEAARQFAQGLSVRCAAEASLCAAVRIAIGHGSAIGVVLREHMPRYDVCGPAVNEATGLLHSCPKGSYVDGATSSLLRVSSVASVASIPDQNRCLSADDTVARVPIALELYSATTSVNSRPERSISYSELVAQEASSGPVKDLSATPAQVADDSAVCTALTRFRELQSAAEVTGWYGVGRFASPSIEAAFVAEGWTVYSDLAANKSASLSAVVFVALLSAIHFASSGDLSANDQIAAAALLFLASVLFALSFVAPLMALQTLAKHVPRWARALCLALACTLMVIAVGLSHAPTLYGGMMTLHVVNIAMIYPWLVAPASLLPSVAGLSPFLFLGAPLLAMQRAALPTGWVVHPIVVLCILPVPFVRWLRVTRMVYAEERVLLPAAVDILQKQEQSQRCILSHFPHALQRLVRGMEANVRQAALSWKPAATDVLVQNLSDTVVGCIQLFPHCTPVFGRPHPFGERLKSTETDVAAPNPLQIARDLRSHAALIEAVVRANCKHAFLVSVGDVAILAGALLMPGTATKEDEHLGLHAACLEVVAALFDLQSRRSDLPFAAALHVDHCSVIATGRVELDLVGRAVMVARLAAAATFPGGIVATKAAVECLVVAQQCAALPMSLKERCRDVVAGAGSSWGLRGLGMVRIHTLFATSLASLPGSIPGDVNCVSLPTVARLATFSACSE